jgi:hypothetical protein
LTPNLGPFENCQSCMQACIPKSTPDSGFCRFYLTLNLGPFENCQ